MLRLKPTPFCFLDEIEAALDDGNISTFADYRAIFQRTRSSSSSPTERARWSRCDGLYGVAMEEKGSFQDAERRAERT